MVKGREVGDEDGWEGGGRMGEGRRREREPWKWGKRKRNQMN